MRLIGLAVVLLLLGTCSYPEVRWQQFKHACNAVDGTASEDIGNSRIHVCWRDGNLIRIPGFDREQGHK